MTTAPEPALVDTNVLVYFLFPAMPAHAASRALLDTAKAAGTNRYVAPQNLKNCHGLANPRAQKSTTSCRV